MGRLVGASFLLLLLTVSLVGYLVYVEATRSLTQSVYDRLHAVSTLKEDGLNRWVEQQRLNLVFIAWQPEVRRLAGNLLDETNSTIIHQGAYASLSDYLKFVVTSVSDSDELSILDMNGRVRLSTQSSHEGQMETDTPYFTLGRVNTFVQPVYNAPDTGRPTIAVATPLFNVNKRRVGVMVAHLNLARVDRIILERTGLGSSGETYLVNPSHDFVSAALFANPDFSKAGQAKSQGISLGLEGEDGYSLYTNYQGIPVIGYYNWLGDRGVVLMAEMSQEEAFAPARQLAATTVEFGVASAVVLAGLAYLLARRIARPILAITQTASRVAAGDLNQTAPVMTDDEVGLLAQAFNHMTGELRLLYEGLEKKVAERTADLVGLNTLLGEEIAERERVALSLRESEMQLRNQNEYLAALHATSLGLISRLNLTELFETLVMRAGQLLDTPNGFIYIAEPGASEIECRVGVGIFRDLVGFHVPMGEGLGGKVWESGETLVVNDYDHWSGRAKNLDQNLIRSIVGLPLKTGSQVMGVIGLAYDCGDEHAGRTFGDNEVELLDRFAQLAAIALDNARLYTGANEARAAAEAANESKSEFLANVSHELRTPLTSILGFARIVQKRLEDRILPLIAPDDPRVQRAVEQIEDNLKIILTEGDRLTTLINELLDLEKIRAGKMVWRMETLRIAEIIDRAAAATAALFDAKGLRWVRDVPDDLPVITGDPDRLVQVVINLISNAVKFTHQGDVTCRVQQADAELVVSITDQGIGIAPEDQALVFEKFRQVGDTLTGKPKGTGLGLPISKEIIEHHGGRIWLESIPGQGSTFFFALPLDKNARRRAAAATAGEGPADGEGSAQKVIDVQVLLSQLKPRIAAAPFSQAADRKSVLVVDDDDHIRSLLRQELEAEHYQVYEAENGRSALEQVKRVRPDLLLLDVLMPEINGFDVAAVLKHDPETMNLPIVIISILQDQDRGYHLGIDRFFNKPINVPALMHEVKVLLDQGGSHKKVLVVDEDTTTVQLLSEALVAQNYQVTAAFNGAEGLQKALTDHPDMVIVNSLVSDKVRLVQVLRFEKGLEDIIFLLFR